MLSTKDFIARARRYLAEYMLVLGDARRELRGIGAALLILAFLDLLGVGLVAPFAQMLTTGAPLEVMSALDPSPQLAFTLLGLLLVAVFAAKALLGYSLNRKIAAFSAGYRAKLIRRLISAYQAQSLQFHVERNSSELLTRVLWHTHAYSGQTLGASLYLVTNGVICFALFALLAISDFVSVIILAVLLGAVFLATHRLVRPRLNDAVVEYAARSEQVTRGTKQALEGFREIRVLGTEDHFKDEVGRAADALAVSSARRTALGTVPRYVFEVAVVTVLVVIGGVSALLHGSPASAVPVLGMFAAAAMRLLPASTAALSSLNLLRSSRFVLRDLAAELSAVAPFDTASNSSLAKRAALPKFECLEMVNVTFSYPGSAEPVLRDIHFSIRAGETIGLTGRSGAGKSTLADLLLGFLVPQSGEVRVNGHNIHDNLPAWLQRATYIPQSVFLLDDTLRRNIEFGAAPETASVDRMSSAIQQAQLADLIASLPDGLDTLVGERGARLSGGQRQRVALARALYHEREFIVLDEATSALDDETEDAVVKAVMQLTGTRTLFVIAHRDATLAGCSTRLVLQDGRLFPFARTDPSTALDTHSSHSVG
jgi:ATP-binding cassette, subfamily B, bacterial PglK